MTIDARPTNDEFEAAEKTPSSLGWYWSGTTRLATKQAGEPDHGGDPGGHSVWYSWTPTKSAPVELDSCATDFDPVVAIYTGATVGSLTPVPTSDAGTGQCDEGVSTGFDAVAGTTYRIAVDGAGGDDGSFELHLRPAIEHPRSLSVSSTGAGSVVADAVDCTSLCSYDFEVGDSVSLSAQPAPGSSFVGWSGGGCSGVGSCEIVLNTDATVVANFTSAAGGGGEGGGGGTVPPTPQPPAGPESPPTPKPLRCKPGFKKTREHGKARCVRKKRHHRKRGHGAR